MEEVGEEYAFCLAHTVSSHLQAADRIVMAPSGVQKERMEESDLFVLDEAGNILETPAARPPPAKPPKLSECSPLFMAARSWLSLSFLPLTR